MTEQRPASVEEASALIAGGNIGQARERLYERILLAPDDYRARLLLRGTFQGQGEPMREPADDHQCPCCGNTFSMFLSGGPSFRPEVCCPACESLERHRFLALMLSRFPVLIGQGATMLHVAAEPCLSDRFRRVFGLRYHTMDMFTRADFNGDVCSLPIVSQSLDVVMANHILEHVLDDLAAMKELLRVLRPGGKAFLQIPMNTSLAATQEAPEGATPQELLRLFGQEDHVRMYGLDFKDRMERAGFAVRMHRCGDGVTEEETRLYGLAPDDILWEATKP